MDFLNDVLKAVLEKVLGDDFAAFESKVNAHNEAAKDEDKIKLGNLATGKYVDAGKYEGDTGRLKTENQGLSKQVEGLQSDLKAIEGSTGDVEKIKADAKAALETSEELVKTTKADADTAALDSEIRLAIAYSGAKDEKSVMAHIDKSKVSRHEGKLIGLSDQLETISKEHDYLFGAPKKIIKTNTINPPPPEETGASEWQGKIDAIRKSDSPNKNREAIALKQEAAEAGVIIN